jgi:zinc transporter 1/2/3
MSATCADVLAELSAANATIADLVVQLSALTAVAEEPVEDPCALADAATYDRAFHIGAAFIVLAASGLGVASTLVGKRFPALRLSDTTIVLGKTFGTGIVLATALVHMLQPGTSSFASECVAGIMGEDYPAYSFLFALLAAMVMQGLEYAAGRAVAARKADSIVSTECPVIDCPREVITADSSTDDAAIAVSVPRHSHSIGAHSTLVGLLMVEFSFTLHSIFIGLAVGLSGGDGLNALLTALVFHQFFEGLSLGARLHESSMSSQLDMVFAVVFAAAAPIGIGIAVGLMGSAVPVQGATFLVVQGVFDSICAGILLYIGFSLLLLDFPADMAKLCSDSEAGGKLTGPQAEGRRVVQYATLWAGAGLMAFLGRYL